MHLREDFIQRVAHCIEALRVEVTIDVQSHRDGFVTHLAAHLVDSQAGKRGVAG